MNDAALGRFIDRGNERAEVACLRGGGIFAQSANATDDAPVSQSAGLRLAGAFGGGFGVGHDVKLRAGASGLTAVLSTGLARAKSSDDGRVLSEGR
jgi:hypothetical protein